MSSDDPTRHDLMEIDKQGRQSTRSKWLTALTVLAIILSALALIKVSGDNQRQADDAEALTLQISQVVTAGCADPAKAKVLGSLCPTVKQIIVEGVQGAPGKQGVQGLQGPAGPPPSAADVSAAVARYCGLSGCQGRTPTQAEVLAALTTFCAADACRGVAGNTGATGATGPGPTTEQLASAASNYCEEHNGCRGDTGNTGPAGRGIASIACKGAGNLAIDVTYSDGTTQSVTCEKGT